MSANQENFESDGCVSSDGGHDIHHKYDKPECTKEQRAHLNAAMLGMMASTFIFFNDDLGIGRKDTLPLEDGGNGGNRFPVSRAASTQPRPNTNPGVAAWQNYTPDDVDDADLQLDTIADGKLYRMRRGDSSGLTNGRNHQNPRHRRKRDTRGDRQIKSNTSVQGTRDTGNQKMRARSTDSPQRLKPYSNDHDDARHYIQATAPELPEASRSRANLDFTLSRPPSQPTLQVPSLSSRRRTPLVQNPGISGSRWGGNGIDNTAAFMIYAELEPLGSTKAFSTTSNLDVAANKSPPLVSIKQSSTVELPKTSVNFVPINVTLATSNSAVVTPSPIEPVLPLVVEEHILQQTSPHVQAVSHLIENKEVGLANSRWAAPDDPDPLSVLQPLATGERYQPPIQAEYIAEVSVRQNPASNVVVSSGFTSVSAVQISYQQTARLEQDEQLAVQPVHNPDLEGNKSTFSEMTSTTDDGSIGDLMFFTEDEEPATVDDGSSIEDLIFLAGDEEPEPLSNGISLSVMQDLREIYDGNMTMEPRFLKSIELMPDTKQDVSNSMQPNATEVPRESKATAVVTATIPEVPDVQIVQLVEDQKALSTLDSSTYSDLPLLSSDEKGPPSDSVNGKLIDGGFIPTTNRLFESSDKQPDLHQTELTEIGGASLNESASPSVPSSGIYSNIFTVSNTDLKGIPGLSSSRWFDAA